jgi:pyrimidine operon attenuation protein / uracil phosphoribosyltransferase
MNDTTNLDSLDVDEALVRMGHALRPLTDDPELAMVGIRTGGVWVAERLHALLGLKTDLGALNINFYRDDFTRVGMHPQVTPSDLPFTVENRHIVLVDDVLYTGRTIRAALNELFDFGRPSRVTLAVLVERDGRDLPFQADVCAEHVKLRSDQYIKLAGPDPLELAFATRLST